ncbi:MAG TPA: hypothetical protein VMN38_00510 [Sphingomicrobium sp.]|nr:hypothetical protein [Sphingomicrobium sp.]
MKLIIVIALLLVLAVAVMMILRPSGPRVTHIEHRRDEIDDAKDRDE